MIPDVDEIIEFPCTVWVRALRATLATADALLRQHENATAATYFCSTLQDRVAASGTAEAVLPYAGALDTSASASSAAIHSEAHSQLASSAASPSASSAAHVLDQYPLACALRQYARGVNTHKVSLPSPSIAFRDLPWAATDFPSPSITHKVSLVRVRDVRGKQRMWANSHTLKHSSVSGRCISTGYVAHLSTTTRTTSLTGAKMREGGSVRTRRDYAVIAAINARLPALVRGLCLNASDPRSQRRFAMSQLVKEFEARDRNNPEGPSVCEQLRGSVDPGRICRRRTEGIALPTPPASAVVATTTAAGAAVSPPPPPSAKPPPPPPQRVLALPAPPPPQRVLASPVPPLPIPQRATDPPNRHVAPHQDVGTATHQDVDALRHQDVDALRPPPVATAAAHRNGLSPAPGVIRVVSHRVPKSSAWWHWG